MEHPSDHITTITPLSSPPLSRSLSPLKNNPMVVISPCAACKILRRRCADKCVLAPYFPPNDPLKFTTAHRVFGASNIIKFLQELPEYQRVDAVSSMVYEAKARLRDPIYGSAGVICQLQEQVNELQAQLAKARAQIVNMQCQQADLMTLICKEMSPSPPQLSPPPVNNFIDNFALSPNNFMDNSALSPLNFQNNSSFFDDCNTPGSLWEPLWT